MPGSDKTTDYFSYRVNRKWYQLYRALTFSFSCLVLIGYIVVHTIPGLQYYVGVFGLHNSALLFSGLDIIYLTFVYRFVERKDVALASAIAAMLYILVIISGLTHTDPHAGAWIYAGAWLVTSLLDGIYGLPLLLGSVLVVALYVLIVSHFDPSAISAVSATFLGGSIVIAFLVYPLWRRQFFNNKQLQVDRLAQMLSSNQQQSEILIQSISDGVIVINTEGKVTLINAAAAAMTEWPINEATGIDVQLVATFRKEDGQEMTKADNPFTKILQTKKQSNQKLQLIGRQGKNQVVSLVISPVIVPEGDVVGAVAVLRDVSAEHASEQQRAEFISTASHEMRTPIAAIEGYLALAMNDKASSIDSRARAYLEKAHASTRHLGELFQDLLTSSRVEDGRLAYHPKVIEMGQFLEQAMDDLRFSAQVKHLETEFVIGSSEETALDNNEQPADGIRRVIRPFYYVHADPDRLREVISNLFDNAVKYTTKGKISVGLTGDNNVVQFYVRDTGTGIPADDVPHLFQKFYRVDNSATRTIGGTGLGLFIARKMVELCNGRIWVTSEFGKGSTFFVNLPRLTSQRAEELQASEATTPAVLQRQNNSPPSKS